MGNFKVNPLFLPFLVELFIKVVKIILKHLEISIIFTTFAAENQIMTKMQKIRVEVEWCDKNFAATLGGNVPGSVLVTAKTYSKLQKEVKETLKFHIEGMVEDGDKVPQWLVDGDYDFKWVMLDTASLLQSLEGMTTIAAISRATGINERLLSHYANGLKRPSAKQRQKITDGIHSIGKVLINI